jgi:hypothetical protein
MNQQKIDKLWHEISNLDEEKQLNPKSIFMC